MRKLLIESLPPKIAEIQEFKEITSTEDIEINSLEEGQKRILNENFINTATQYGVKRYEELFKIRADTLNESLEFRKLRLKNRKLDKAPFTHKFLCNKLETLFGKDNYKVEVENDIYTLKVEVNTFDWNMFNEIIDNFRYIIPCNMLMESTLIQKLRSKLYIGSCLLSGEATTVYPWTPNEIEIKGKINMALGVTAGNETVTLYPKKEG